MSYVIRLITVLSILATCTGLQASTKLLVVTGSGEFVSRVPAVTVATPPAAGAFQLVWSTTEKGAVSLSWEVSTGTPATVVLSGKQLVAPGATGGYLSVSSAFLSAQAPADPKTYEIRVTLFDAQQNALGPPSSPVTVTQHKEAPSPPTNFGNPAVFPSLKFLKFEGHVTQVAFTQIESVTASIKIQVSNKGKTPTDPMWLSIIDKNSLLVAKAPAALPQMKPGEKPIDLTLQLAPLLPATTSELESSRYDAWDRSLRTKGVDIAGTLDWRGPVQNTPMEPHLEVPLFQGKTDSCHDGKLDGDEVLVDCGGSCSGGASTAFNLCSNQLDINGLQLNPIWEWQITHPEQTPDFLATCGADPSTCTNQPVLFDVIGPGTLVFPVPAAGVPLPDFATTCPRDPFSGHANWRIATFEGKIVWDTHDDPLMGDDDYNMYFVPDHKAALTSERSWLSLEFQAGETINGFSSPWWTAFHSAVDNPFPEQGHAASQILNGQYAIVTGLIGIDGVHGGYTESHPVFSLAILTGQTNAGAVVEENWSLFIRNWGNEGFCSQQQHYWDTSNGEYWIQLRWPEGATRVEVDVNNTHVFTNQAGLEPPAIWRGQGWLYLLFHLPTPEQKAYFDGDLTLRYSFPQGKAPTAPPLELAKTIKPAGAKPSVKEGFQVYVVQIADPQARARYQRVLQEWHAAQPPRAIVRIPVQLSSTVRTYEASEQRKASAPGRERAVTDQERAKHLEDLHKRMEVEFGKQVP